MKNGNIFGNYIWSDHMRLKWKVATRKMFQSTFHRCQLFVWRHPQIRIQLPLNEMLRSIAPKTHTHTNRGKTVHITQNTRIISKHQRSRERLSLLRILRNIWMPQCLFPSRNFSPDSSKCIKYIQFAQC